MNRHIFLKQLNAAVICAQASLDTSFLSKLLRSLRNPKKAILRKIIVGFFGQKKLFTLKAKTFFGRTIYVNNYEPQLWFCGVVLSQAEIRLTKYIIKHLADGGVFFDVGAHHGIYTLLVHDLTDGNVPIYAFEPSPTHSDLLKKTVRHLVGVTVVPVAVNSTNNPTTFYENDRTVSTLDKAVTEFVSNARLSFKEIIVPSITIDSYCNEHDVKPSFIKIDVEGAEQAVIEGALDILRTEHPVIALEVWGENNNHHLEAVRILKDIGYVSYRILDSGDIKAIPEDKPIILNNDQFDNIIFIFSA